MNPSNFSTTSGGSDSGMSLTVESIASKQISESAGWAEQALKSVERTMALPSESFRFDEELERWDGLS